MAPPNDPIFSVLKSDSEKNSFDLSHENFSVKGIPLLSDVPNNVSFKTFSSVFQSSDAPIPLVQRVQSISNNGGFIGFTAEERSDQLMNSLGRFSGRDFVSIFRFKTWWSTQWVGNSGSDLQMETQWVLLNVPELSSYVLILPTIEGKFRSALHPGSDGHVMICAESGSTQVKASNFDAIAYVHLSNNPYKIMKEAYTALRVHLNTFKLLEEKSAPPIVDKFGWCTWDAFYLTVEPAGVWHGVREFTDGGISPRFIVIDDGWQSMNLDGEDPNKDTQNLVLGGTQMTARLHRLDEGEKFRNYKSGSFLGPNLPPFDANKPKKLISKAIELEQAEKVRAKAVRSGTKDVSQFDLEIKRMKLELDQIFVGERKDSGLSQGGCGSFCCKTEENGMKGFTNDLRRKFKGLDDIYVWHALCGAWGGVRPGKTHLNSKVIPCKVSQGLDGTMEDLAVVKVVEGGIGLVHPDQAEDFYDSMHSYLSKVGITGVKVDVIHTLEYVSEEYGGRVELARTYYKGISKSISKNFNGTGLISSMQQCNDFFFLGTEKISMGRVGDDFWFQDPYGDPSGVYWLQGVHMVHCAYNSMWMGQIIQPDWDMFQSDHVCAKFHAGSRAICGGPVYVSDSLGGHDFDLLKKLVYPDGTISKCQQFALPTRDCLFSNPLFDNKTILKIWNFNKYGGVIGAFNCQGAGWDPKERMFKGKRECYRPMSGSVHVREIEWDQNEAAAIAKMGEAEEYVVYLNQAEKVIITTPKSDPIQMTIDPSSFEIFTFVPIKNLGLTNTKFAPIGLTNMFNSGGAIKGLNYSQTCVKMEVKGAGNLLIFSSGCPKLCCLNGADVGFDWSGDGKLTVDLPWVEETDGNNEVTFLF